MSCGASLNMGPLLFYGNSANNGSPMRGYIKYLDGDGVKETPTLNGSDSRALLEALCKWVPRQCSSWAYYAKEHEGTYELVDCTDRFDEALYALSIQE
jgi:hypothetical protein